MERFFHIQARGSNLRTEILGGVTTFLTMAYIVVLNPAILQAAHLPIGPSTVATILTAVFGCALMGLLANRPIAVAPYMGENAFLAFGLATMLIDGQHVTWQQRLGTVFLSGAAFLVLTLLRLRTWLAAAISPSLKHSFALGIGMFLLFIGLYLTGIVTNFVTGMPLVALPVQDGFMGRPDVPVKIGHLGDPRVLLAIGGFVLMCLLLAWRVRAAILWGMLATAAVGLGLGLNEIGDVISSVVLQPMPETTAPEPTTIAFQLDIVSVLRWEFFPVLLTLFLISFLDTLGTLYALGAAGDMLDEQGNFPQVERPMMVDSLSCMFGALVGTSTSGAYIESASGMRAGARTGVAALVVAGCFALCLFAVPWIVPLQRMTFAYGPALMVVGLLMFDSARRINFDDLTELVPALATVAMMVFTFNIANGLTAGLILHPVMKAGLGRWREVHPAGVVLAAMCAFYFLFGVPH